MLPEYFNFSFMYQNYFLAKPFLLIHKLKKMVRLQVTIVWGHYNGYWSSLEHFRERYILNLWGTGQRTLLSNAELVIVSVESNIHSIDLILDQGWKWDSFCDGLFSFKMNTYSWHSLPTINRMAYFLLQARVVVVMEGSETEGSQDVKLWTSAD